MCRILGYVTKAPVTLADLLGEQDLQDFAELSRKHGDGWGFARAVGNVMEVTEARAREERHRDGGACPYRHRVPPPP